MAYVWRNPLKKLAISIVVVFCALFFHESILKATDKKGVPKIEFDATEKYLGTISEGDDKDFEFDLKNIGDADLRIQRLRSLCDCVEVTIDQTLIRPGSSTILRGIFRSAGRWGEQEKAIIVSSNASDMAQAILKISLVVESGVRITPRSFSFGEIGRKHSATQKVKIEAQLEEELKIKKLSVLSAENVTASILKRKVSPHELPSGTKGCLTEIDIVLKAINDSAGEFSGQLEIQTDSVRNSNLQVLFSGEKTGDLEVEPPVVHFKDATPGCTMKAVTIVKSLRNGPFRVLGLDADQLPITMGEMTDKALDEHQVSLLFTAPEKPRRFYRGYVYILTDHTTQKKIKVGINAVTRDSVP